MALREVDRARGAPCFSASLPVYDFQKRSSLIEVSEAGAQVLGHTASVPAHGEGLPSPRGPKFEFDMLCRKLKILVRGQEDQVMTTAQLDEQRINRSNLYPVPTTGVPDPGGLDVIVPVRLQESKGGKPLDKLIARFRPSETLKQFLQHEPRDEHLVRALQGVA